ncbi:LOW QUALITY PROTEIN: uncharacterized protein LOC128392649, partial [Panonychus citri]|uniref:LOW QUALITY PROTEIN: uncharacterized protein LOC128392649 n=1 Tax=Panonychus citri TaxID=50023 RepID=UPI00230809CE
LLSCFLIIFTASYAILLAYVPFALGGGMFLIYGACYTYVAWSTPPELLIIRFAIMEFVNMSGKLIVLVVDQRHFLTICLFSIVEYKQRFIGTYISGQILIMKPWVPDQARNYIGVLALSTILLMTTLLMASLFKLKNMPKATAENANRKLCAVFVDVFKLSRLNDLFSTFFKRRPNAGRVRLLLLVLSGTLCLGAFHGEETIGYQYAQRVYGWSAEKYSTLYSLLSIIPALATSLGPHILKTCLGLSDSLIGILGTISVFTMNLIHGVILTPYGFILTYITGALHRVSFVAFRSLISTMVDSCEAAKIFTLITVFDSYGALGSAFMYTRVFNVTIQNNPGLTFIIAASILTIPVLTCIWLEITRSKWEPKIPSEKDNIYGQKSHPENAINDNQNHPSPTLMKIKDLTIVNVSEKF